jgi:hypothetical protein
MQAYSFTSAPIAKALVEAHQRGVKILTVLDKSNETDKYSAATFLNNAGIQPLIDDKHAIAHAKVMVIDSATIITGSFNFTKAAEEKNAENLLVIKDAPELATAYEANIRLHAGHAHPYQRQAATGSSGSSPATVSGNGEVHGNKKSKIYHLPDCPGYAGMNPTSLITFANEAAAEQAGYRKARHCPYEPLCVATVVKHSMRAVPAGDAAHLFLALWGVTDAGAGRHDACACGGLTL